MLKYKYVLRGSGVRTFRLYIQGSNALGVMGTSVEWQVDSQRATASLVQPGQVSGRVRALYLEFISASDDLSEPQDRGQELTAFVCCV